MTRIVPGDMILWHPQGRDDTQPFPALVLLVNPGEMLNVLTFNPETGAQKVQSNVWERGSKPLKDNTNLAISRGCWSLRHPEPAMAMETAATITMLPAAKVEQPPFDPTPKKPKKEEPALT